MVASSRRKFESYCRSGSPDQEPAPAKAGGKAHKRYEFGVKASVGTTNHERLVIGMLALPDNPYDGPTLASGPVRAAM